MPQVSITINRPEVSVSTTQSGPTVTISETPVAITQNTSEIAVSTNPQVVQINTAATTIQTTTLDEAFKGDWSADVIYHRGDLVRHEQAVYVYINSTPSTTLHPDVATDLWVLLFSESGLTAPQVEGINRAINMKTWDATTAYSIGDIVMLRQDYDIDVGVTVPYFTMYRLYHISGSINVNPLTHSSPPTTDETGLVFNQDSAWQNLSGVRSINGFSGDVNLQEILDAGSLALNATTFHQGSENNHGSFEAHADDVYLYGNNVYIGQSGSDQMVGFLLSNAGGGVVLALDNADGKLKFSYDFITYYTLPTSTDDLAEGTTNKYYNDSLVDAHLSGGTGVTYTSGEISIGQPVGTTDSPTFNTVYTGVVRSPLNESVSLRAYNDTGAGTNYDLSVATTGQVNLPTGTTGQARVQSTDDISVLAGVKEYVFGTDGTLELPGYTLPATDGSANQVMTTSGTGTVSFATPSTSNITEGTNLYYTDARFDTRLAAKDTDDLAEGGNLYYTTARSNTDFDARLATKSTTNLAEGTNLYYTSGRANADFDTRLATKSTTNLAEGTNLYHTAARARGALSGSTGITYNNTTGSIAIDDTVVATHTYVGTQIANLVDSAPSTLDTLNELAAALGDDPNFATTITTALGNKLNTADFTTTANTWYATSDPIQNNTTDDLSEGTTNLYHTTARVRNSISAGTGIGYNATTGEITANVVSVNGATGAVYLDTDDISEATTNKYYTDTRSRSAISLGYTGITAGLTYNNTTGVFNYVAPNTDDVAEGLGNLYFTADRARSAVANGIDLAVDGSNNVYVKSIRDATRVKGSIEATQNDSYVFPPPTNTWITSNNGFDIASNGAAYSAPYGAASQCSISAFNDDTWAGATAGAVYGMRAANGTSATTGTNPLTGLANTGPTAVTAGGGVLGALNFNGYATTGYSSDVAATHAQGGIQGVHACQILTVPRETFADAVRSITPTAVTRSAPAVTSIVITGTKGQFSCASTTIGLGQAIRITGTLGGTGSIVGYTGDNTYYVVKTNFSTTFTLSATPNGGPITTTAGTPTGLTVTRNIVTFTIPTQTAAPYVAGAKLTVSGITGLTDGVYIVSTSTTTSVIIGAVTTSVALGATPLLSMRLVTNAGTNFIVRGFNTATPMNTTNRQNFIIHGLGSATYKTDSFNIQPAGGTNNCTTITPSSTFLRDATLNTAYASLSSTGNTLIGTGFSTFTRQTTTNGTTPGLVVRHQRTDLTTPNDLDGVDFRLSVGGTTNTYNIARFDAQYRTSGLHEFGISLSNDSFNTDADTVYRATPERTAIRATPAGGGTASDIIVINDAKILNNRPHRGAVTTATIARGTTYTPAAGVNNFIELTLTAGTDPTYIDVDNLTVAGEGGHQAILVYNNSGSTIGVGDLRIRNNGVQISDSHSTVAAGARAIFTVYCVGNYASCEFMPAA